MAFKATQVPVPAVCLYISPVLTTAYTSPLVGLTAIPFQFFVAPVAFKALKAPAPDVCLYISPALTTAYTSPLVELTETLTQAVEAPPRAF